MLQQLGVKPSDMKDILPGQAVIIARNRLPVIESVQPQKAYCPDVGDLSTPQLAFFGKTHMSHFR